MSNSLVSINISIQGVQHTITMKEGQELYDTLREIFDKEYVISPTIIPYITPAVPTKPYADPFYWINCSWNTTDEIS